MQKNVDNINKSLNWWSILLTSHRVYTSSLISSRITSWFAVCPTSCFFTCPAPPPVLFSCLVKLTFRLSLYTSVCDHLCPLSLPPTRLSRVLTSCFSTGPAPPWTHPLITLCTSFSAFVLLVSTSHFSVLHRLPVCPLFILYFTSWFALCSTSCLSSPTPSTHLNHCVYLIFIICLVNLPLASVFAIAFFTILSGNSRPDNVSVLLAGLASC